MSRIMVFSNIGQDDRGSEDPNVERVDVLLRIPHEGTPSVALKRYPAGAWTHPWGPPLELLEDSDESTHTVPRYWVITLDPYGAQVVLRTDDKAEAIAEAPDHVGDMGPDPLVLDVFDNREVAWKGDDAEEELKR